MHDILELKFTGDDGNYMHDVNSRPSEAVQLVRPWPDYFLSIVNVDILYIKVMCVEIRPWPYQTKFASNSPSTRLFYTKIFFITYTIIIYKIQCHLCV